MYYPRFAVHEFVNSIYFFEMFSIILGYIEKIYQIEKVE